MNNRFDSCTGSRAFWHLMPEAEDLAWQMWMKMEHYRLYANVRKDPCRFKERGIVDAVQVPDLVIGSDWDDDSDIELLATRMFALFIINHELEKFDHKRESFYGKALLGTGVALQCLAFKLLNKITFDEYRKLTSVFDFWYGGYDGETVEDGKSWRGTLCGALGEARFFQSYSNVLKLPGFRNSSIYEDLQGADFFIRHTELGKGFIEIPIQVKFRIGYSGGAGFALVGVDGVHGSTDETVADLAPRMISSIRLLSSQGYANRGVFVLLGGIDEFLHCQKTLTLVRDIWNNLK